MQNVICWIYILILAILSIFEVFSYSSNSTSIGKINRMIMKKIFFFMCLILTFLYIFRDPMSGVDDQNYYSNWFLQNKSWGLIVRDFIIPGRDGGYQAILKICRMFSDSYWFSCIVVYLLTLIPLYFFIIKKTKYYLFSLFLYLSLYWVASVTLHRMALCLSISLLSWICIDEGKKKKSLIFIILAASIHISGYITLGYFLVKKIAHNKIWYIVLISTIMAFFSAEIVVPYLVSYYRGGSYNEDLSYNGGINFFILVIIISIMTGIISKYYLNDNTNVYAHNSVAIAIALQVFAFKFSTIVRAVYLYFIQIIIVLPNLLFQMKNKQTKSISLIIIVLFSLVWLWYTGSELNNMRWII